MKKVHNIIAIYIALTILALDQITKFLFRTLMQEGQSVPIIDNIVHFTLVYNRGAGFGILQNQRLFFIVFSLVVLGAIVYKWKKIPTDKFVCLPLGLILGGLFGNLVDRAFQGYVVDFIDFRIWPVFNVADSAITIAVIVLIIYLWKK